MVGKPQSKGLAFKFISQLFVFIGDCTYIDSLYTARVFFYLLRMSLSVFLIMKRFLLRYCRIFSIAKNFFNSEESVFLILHSFLCYNIDNDNKLTMWERFFF